MSDFGGTPLAVGTVTGRRVWNIDHLGRLRGITHPAVWLPGENVATCRRTDQLVVSFTSNKTTAVTCTEANIPVEACGCGFWAYHAGDGRYREASPSSLSAWGGPTEPSYVGVIEGYGRTIIGTKGFRSHKARIVALVIPGNSKADPDRIRLLYPDVDMFETYEAMIEAHPLDDFRPSPDSHPDFWTRETSPQMSDSALALAKYMNTVTASVPMYTFNSGGVV